MVEKTEFKTKLCVTWLAKKLGSPDDRRKRLLAAIQTMQIVQGHMVHPPLRDPHEKIRRIAGRSTDLCVVMDFVGRLKHCEWLLVKIRSVDDANNSQHSNFSRKPL